MPVTAVATIGHNQPPEPIEIEPVRVRILPDGRMSRKDAAKYLGLTPKTLAMWQSQGKLKCVKIGGRAFYFRDQLDELIRGTE